MTRLLLSVATAALLSTGAAYAQSTLSPGQPTGQGQAECPAGTTDRNCANDSGPNSGRSSTETQPSGDNSPGAGADPSAGSGSSNNDGIGGSASGGAGGSGAGGASGGSN